MAATISTAAANLLRSGGVAEPIAELWKPDGTGTLVKVASLNVTGMTTSNDGSSEIPRSCSVTVAGFEGLIPDAGQLSYASVYGETGGSYGGNEPLTYGDKLNKQIRGLVIAGVTQLRLYDRLHLPDGTKEDVPAGRYYVDRPAFVHSTGNGVEVTISGQDVVHRIRQAGYVTPHSGAAGTNVETALRDLFAVVAPGVTLTVPPGKTTTTKTRHLDDFEGRTTLGSIGPWAWTTSATWSVSGGLMQVTGSAAPDFLYFNPAQSDGIFEAVFHSRSGTANSAVVFRSSGTILNGYPDNCFLFSAGSNGIGIYRRDAGTWVTLVAASGAAVMQGDRVAVELSGSSIVVKHNGTVHSSLTDTNHTTLTLHGFHSNGSGDQAWQEAAWTEPTETTTTEPSTSHTTPRFTFLPVHGANPWADAKRLAYSAGWELTTDRTGGVLAFVPADPGTGTAVWDVTEADLSSAATGQDDADAVNTVVVNSATPNDVPVRGVAEMTTGQWSVASIGRRTRYENVELVHTQAQAELYANGILRREAGLVDTVTIETPYTPHLDAWDLVDVTDHTLQLDDATYRIVRVSTDRSTYTTTITLARRLA